MSEQCEAPTSIEAEQGLLGAILINNAAYERVSRFLNAADFAEPIHQKIYDVIGAVLEVGKAANPVTIKPFLPAKEKIAEGVTVSAYLARLAAEAVNVLNAYDYARMIVDMATRRRLIVAAQEIIDAAYDAPPEATPRQMTAEAQAKISNLVDTSVDDGAGYGQKGIGQAYIDEMQAAYKRKEVRGVPIAFDELSRVLSEPCFEEGNTYGLLSSSGEGKTSFTLQLIYHALVRGHPVELHSYDQSNKQIVRQLIAQQHGIEVRRQRVGDLGEKEWATCQQFAQWLDEEAPFNIVQCSHETAAQIVGHARRFVQRPNKRVAKALAAGKVPLMVTDHIGTIVPLDPRADEGSKAKQIGYALKDGARQFAYAHLVLQQRNSKGMARSNPRPIGADLFGGEPAKGAFDAIGYVYRFKKYCEEQKATAAKGADWENIKKVFPSDVHERDQDLVEVGALKVRFGSPYERRQLEFEGRFTRFKPLGAAVEQEANFL